MDQTLDIQLALKELNSSISYIQGKYSEWIETGEEWLDPDWSIEKCFLCLLTILESTQLTDLREMLLKEYIDIKHSKEGFKKEGSNPDNEPFPAHLLILRQYYYSVSQFFPSEDQKRVTKDLDQILRDIHYSIADKAIFGRIPTSENDVHLRIEGILKPVFPDLKHKPSLTKSIKNFEPDTGIPSISTLIEYKFLDSKDSVSTIADEILADTRGYLSKDWDRFIYVIYETHRFRPEKEWNQLLRQSGVPDNTTVIVLSGEPIKKRKKHIK